MHSSIPMTDRGWLKRLFDAIHNKFKKHALKEKVKAVSEVGAAHFGSGFFKIAVGLDGV